MPLTIDNSACERIIDVLSAEPVGKRVRVSVQGGGCSGYQYGFELDDQTGEDDVVITVTPPGSPRPYEVVVDVMSMTFLDGATLHYTQQDWDSRFTIENPNAQSTCGCGSSFSV